jgi:hypothetical protein
MTRAEQYQYERGIYESYQTTLQSRLACAPTSAARQQIWSEGDQIRARLAELADQVQRNAIINTPGSIGADMATVSSLVQQLDADIAASKATQQFKTGWRGFVDEWEKFKRDTGYWGRWWYATKEHVDEYRRRVHDWRVMFVAEGGTPTGPEDHPPEVRRWWKAAALGLGAALVGGVVIASIARRRDSHREEENRSNG